jgi:hypothetical protein
MNDLTADRAADGQSSGLRRLGAGLLALGIAGSALAVGAVHTWVLCVVVALLAGAAWMTWWTVEPVRVRPAETILVVVAAGLTLYTGLQCVPLPASWLARLAPYGAAVWSRALSPLGEAGPAWTPVSLDPTASRIELLKGMAYLCALLSALRVARRGGATFLGNVIVGTGVAVALLACLHPVLGLHKLYGFYDPGRGIGERHIAPLMNPNNLAGYLNLALCIALAKALSSDRSRHRAWLAIAFVALVAAQIWVASRAGVVTTVVGAVTVVGLALTHRFGRSGKFGVTSIFIALVAVLGAAMVVLASSDEAAGELLDADISKAAMFGHAMRMLPSFFFFGCGRGAFESAYPAFRADTGHVTFTHPENVVAEWTIEWGVPVAIAALVSIAIALRPRASWSQRGAVQGAWAGLVALAVQNLGDLGSEVPAVALAGVVCAAMVVGGAPGRREARAAAWSRHPRVLALWVAVGAFAAILLAAGGTRGELYADRKELHDAVLERHVARGEMHALARAAMLRHPAEPYLPFMTALRASRERDDDGMPWIEATLERAPVYAPAHLVLARLVARRSPSQARLEYRFAMEQEPALVGTVMAEAPRVVEGYYDATELVPHGRMASGVVEMLSAAIRPRLPATARRLDRWLASTQSPASALRTAEDAVGDLEPGRVAPWCRDADAKARCVSLALETSEVARSLSPSACGGYALLARARLAAGGIERALADLEKAAHGVEDREACLGTLVVLARSAGEVSRAERVLDELARSACISDQQCAQMLRWVSAQEEAMGHPQRAFAVCRHGHERVPEDVDLLQCSARLAARAGLHAEAAEEYAELVRRRPDEAALREALGVEQAAAMKGVVEGR